MEGNFIDTERMLGARVLKEAEKPSGNAEALADSTDGQPELQILYLLFVAGRLMFVCSGTFGLHLLSVISIIYFSTKQKVEDSQSTGGTVVLSFLRLASSHRDIGHNKAHQYDVSMKVGN